MSDLPPLVVKQVIVIRKNLNMRKGKMVAQGAHASLGVILMMFAQKAMAPDAVPWDWAALSEWLDGTQSKICVSVDSEAELLALRDEADEAGLPTKLIRDLGHTEFHGVPTLTSLAIGPARVEVIDKVTGKLKLL